jgi:hypothetical protein
MPPDLLYMPSLHSIPCPRPFQKDGMHAKTLQKAAGDDEITWLLQKL